MESYKRLLRLLKTQPLALTLALGGLVGLVVSAEAGSHWLERPHPMSEPRYLVARRALTAGEPIDFLDFALWYARDVGPIPRGALTDQDLDLLKSAVLESDLAEGAVLTAAKVSGPGGRVLSATAIPKGKLAYSFSAYDALMARGGDHIDILLEPESRSSASTLVEDALVLEALPPTDDGETPSSRGLVVALGREEIELLENARHRGRLKIVLRNPQDSAQGLSSRHQLPEARTKRAVEILSEGP